MIALPLPLIFALLILFLLVHALRHGGTGREVIALLALCAWQSFAISLVHYYGLRWLMPALPLVACALPPVAWLTFRAALFEPVTLSRAAPHALAPAFGLFCLIAAPASLDLAVPALFVGYGAAILWALRPANPLPRARLDAGPWPARTWQALAAALLLSAVGDLVIALAFMTGRPEVHGLVVSLVSSVSLVMVAVLALTRDGMAPPETDPSSPAPPKDRAEDRAEDTSDADLLTRLERLMQTERLFLEPDLTLARIARRLRVPAKQLSTVINRQTGENVSRHVNSFRIRHACALLRNGVPVTEAIYACGFNTKSNFNREFLRVTGQSPSAWRDTAADAM
ncbi:helix-turn-helix domain-containing protein [Antarctobacter heliothermus]|uniref:AraC-type DNA-binding protein n=1 Tax=Antarctobacter heliothermus TaxID=74033 RepID=A0A239GAZ3_9RHOB|nr:AraC family transcriptional regulator [Antarctobacter heliothermus]SNS66506.1 AraC-type DNA-binding protein [Antarctobacter heliothermus]